MAGETLAWRVIKPGHKVFDRDGETIGTVSRVLADDGADIFHGVSMKRGALGPEVEITADNIDRIEEDALHTSLTGPELDP
jgi:PRC-barrel domain